MKYSALGLTSEDSRNDMKLSARLNFKLIQIRYTLNLVWLLAFFMLFICEMRAGSVFHYHINALNSKLRVGDNGLVTRREPLRHGYVTAAPPYCLLTDAVTC